MKNQVRRRKVWTCLVIEMVDTIDLRNRRCVSLSLIARNHRGLVAYHNHLIGKQVTPRPLNIERRPHLFWYVELALLLLQKTPTRSQTPNSGLSPRSWSQPWPRPQVRARGKNCVRYCLPRWQPKVVPSTTIQLRSPSILR